MDKSKFVILVEAWSRVMRRSSWLNWAYRRVSWRSFLPILPYLTNARRYRKFPGRQRQRRQHQDQP